MNRLSYSHHNTWLKPVEWTIHLIFSSAMCLLISGCGDDGFDPKSVLKSYRVIALHADPAELSLTAPSVISMYDFHPDELSGDRPNIEYSWRLCPFSLGSVTQYECLLDEIPLVGQSHEEIMGESTEDDSPTALPIANAQLILNPIELGNNLQMQMEQLEMGAGMLGSEMNFFEFGLFEVYLKVTIKIEGEADFELVKGMVVNLDEERTSNRNPELDQIDFSEALNKDQPLKVSSQIEIEASAKSGSAEEYQAPQSAEDVKNGISSEMITESLLVSYYTTSGTFKQAVKLIEDSSSELTIGEEVGDQLLYIVLRDGRGGVDIQKYPFKVEE